MQNKIYENRFGTILRLCQRINAYSLGWLEKYWDFVAGKYSLAMNSEQNILAELIWTEKKLMYVHMHMYLWM